MYQRLIEVCRQAGISVTFIKLNLSAPAPRICGSSLFRRKPTDTVKHIIPPLCLAPSPPYALCFPLPAFPPLPLCPVIASTRHLFISPLHGLSHSTYIAGFPFLAKLSLFSASGSQRYRGGRPSRSGTLSRADPFEELIVD